MNTHILKNMVSSAVVSGAGAVTIENIVSFAERAAIREKTFLPVICQNFSLSCFIDWLTRQRLIARGGLVQSGGMNLSAEITAWLSRNEWSELGPTGVTHSDAVDALWESIVIDVVKFCESRKVEADADSDGGPSPSNKPS